MNIYVGNLSRTVTEEKLRELFEQYGEVTTIKLIKDKFTGALKGFAFVEMPSTTEANQAMTELNGKEFEGQRLRVNQARPPQPRTGGGNGGGYNNGPRRPSSRY